MPASPTTPPKSPTAYAVAVTPPAAPPPPPAYRQRPNNTSYLTSFIRWLQLKKYQYEVTFSLYMLTSTEKFIFNFIVSTLFLLLITAATMYLPNHVTLIYNRIWYYVHGEFAFRTNGNSSPTSSLATKLLQKTLTSTVTGTVTQTKRIFVETAREL